MAIFRGGKRLGPFDLRIGLPRGREYDKFEKPDNANPETTINRFRSAISKGEGVARTNRFLVRISTPPGDKIRNVLKTTLRENVEAPSQIQGADGLGDGVVLEVIDGVIDGVTELVGVTDGVIDGVTLGVILGVTEGVIDGVTLGVTDGVVFDV